MSSPQGRTPPSPSPLLNSVARTVLIFIALLAAIALVLEWEFFERVLVGPLTRVTTWLSGGILRLSGYAVEVEGTYLVSGGFSMNVLNGCNGVYAISIFLAAIAAYPSRWSEKARGAALGGVLLFLVNVGRVVSLFLIGVHIPEWLEWFHIYFWQTGIVLIAILIWFFWEDRMVRHEEAG